MKLQQLSIGDEQVVADMTLSRRNKR